MSNTIWKTDWRYYASENSTAQLHDSRSETKAAENYSSSALDFLN